MEFAYNFLNIKHPKDLSYLFKSICACNICMMYVCMCMGVCDTEKNSVESAPSLPLLWVLGFAHKSPGLRGECFYSLSHSPGCTVFLQNDCHLSMTSEQMWFCCHPRHICKDETCWALGQAGSCSVCSLGSSASVVSPLLPLPQTVKAQPLGTGPLWITFLGAVV